MLKEPWVAASRTHPCPICGRSEGTDDWCFFIPDQVANCQRVPSAKPGKRSGWIHSLRKPDPFTHFRPTPRAIKPASPPVPKRNDLHILAQRFKRRMCVGRLNLLVSQLGLSHESLRRLDIGWAAGEPMETRDGRTVRITAWSFPMRNAAGEIVGIRMRSPNHRKFSFTGGSGGLFIPNEFHGGRAYLVEGPTDTAAALDMGLNAFGRESCNSGIDHIKAFLQRWRFSELVILSQRDEAKPIDKRNPQRGVYYPAQDGAERIVGIARLYVPSVRVILPPEGVKDVRIWLQQGGTGADVEREVLRSQSRKLSVQTKSLATSLSREGTSK